jgi:crossover junction endodeoxyribonuclease RuvC
VKKGKEPIYIGIDPGTTGAIGLIHPDENDLTLAIDIPAVKIAINAKTRKGKPRKRRMFDLGAIWKIFQPIKEYRDRVVVCLEKAQTRPTDNGLTGLAVGISYGLWPLFLHSHEIILEEEIPSVWKRRMGLLGADKEASRRKAQELFPSASLSRAKDHNRAEALLLAAYIKKRRNEL